MHLCLRRNQALELLLPLPRAPCADEHVTRQPLPNGACKDWNGPDWIFID
jgi:hypothetical protein